MAVLKRISRYPVKGLSPEDMPEVDLASGRGLPCDRAYALALADTEFDEANPRPLPKTKFAVLARFARLAALQTKMDVQTATLSLSHAGSIVASGCLDTTSGRESIEQAIDEFMAGELNGRPRVVKGNGHRFTDISVHSPVLMEAVSIINLSTVRALETKLQKPIDPRRFRGNLLVDGIDPWAEFGLIDRNFKIGDVTVRGVRRTKRCPATEVNPDTAERDIRVPLELLEHFGHGDLGIYVTILSDGVLRVGDPIELSA
ncbi:MAG TPA: MOSC domain-containing protein [Bradyrhizobium sp.]|nr:MOSC domain-containing protein [Bradyrhizobium sp.]